VLSGNGTLSTAALLTEIGSGRYMAEVAACMKPKTRTDRAFGNTTANDVYVLRRMDAASMPNCVMKLASS
jgi:hypothetical protein